VDEIQSSKESKRRAKLILKTITGELSVREACERIGVGPTQFANLRVQFLRFGAEGLKAKPAGRRPRPRVVSERELELMQRNAELEREIRLLKAQAEVASLRRHQESTRSKSSAAAVPRPTTSRPTPPSADAAGGAVP
jgi:transposase-like protein